MKVQEAGGTSALLLRQDTCSGHASELKEGKCELVSKLFNIANCRNVTGLERVYKID